MVPACEDDLSEILVRSTTILERLDSGFVPAPGSSADAAYRRLEAWCQAVAGGDRLEFHRRLGWDGLDEERALRLLGRVRPAAGLPDPDWAGVLARCLRSPDTEGSAAPLCPGQPIPFEDVLLPFVREARSELLSRASEAVHAGLSEEALAGAERQLLGNLSTLSASTLNLEFRVFVAAHRSSLDRLLRAGQEGRSRALYDRFVSRMRESGLARFFREYAFLARLLATTALHWAESLEEFASRLIADSAILGMSFGLPSGTARAAAIAMDLSDRHNRGRTVFRVDLEGGATVLYKPKDVCLERAWFDLLRWLENHGAPLDLKTLTVLERLSYGWVETAFQEPCRDAAEAERYFRRTGALLAVVHALGGSDCHYENLIASGEHPVLIDAETLIRPAVRDEEDPASPSAFTTAIESLRDSVLGTGILPSWRIGPRGGAVDISSLGSFEDQPTDYPAPLWEHVNTDDMSLRWVDGRIPPQANVPRLGREPLRAECFVDALAQGFRGMYTFLAEWRGKLLAPGGPLARLRDLRVRMVFRDTETYTALLQLLLRPEHLRDGADAALQLEMLARPFLGREAPPRAWPLVRAELEAMTRLDVPYFHAGSDSADLVLPCGRRLEGFFSETALARAGRSLARLGEEDLERQLGYIRSSFYCRSHRASHASGEAREEDTPPPLGAGECIDRALEIAKEIRKRAILSPDGSAAWVTIDLLPEARRFQYQPMGAALYAGTSGIGVFLAALASATGQEDVRSVAVAAIRTVRENLGDGERLRRMLGIGGGTGLGSLVYAFSHMAGSLEDRALLADARRTARLISRDSIGRDRGLDVVTGAAGAILGLLKLREMLAEFDEHGEEEAVDRARLCGLHLLERRAPTPEGPRSWTAKGERRPLTGFSHGAAGIAYALVRLHAATGDRRFREAACEGIAYERSVFDSEVGLWPDFREVENGAVTGWCHGATGIGLARLACLPVLGEEGILGDIETALAATRRIAVASGVDHLCCGNFGRIETALYAGGVLHRPELGEVARRWAAQVVHRRNRVGAYQLLAGMPRDVYSPGFFQGTSGIGYALLRLAFPERLPPVLLWR